MVKNDLQWVVKAIGAALIVFGGVGELLITNTLSKLLFGRTLDPFGAVVGLIPFGIAMIFLLSGFTKNIKISLKTKTTVAAAAKP